MKTLLLAIAALGAIASSPAYADYLFTEADNDAAAAALAKEAVASNLACAHEGCVRRSSDHGWEVWPMFAGLPETPKYDHNIRSADWITFELAAEASWNACTNNPTCKAQRDAEAAAAVEAAAQTKRDAALAECNNKSTAVGVIYCRWGVK